MRSRDPLPPQKPAAQDAPGAGTPQADAARNAIRVNGIDIEWQARSGTCTFQNLPVAMMWVDSTLAGLFSGVQAMVGTERYLLALQREGRKSVEADWRIISQFDDFGDGFKAIAAIASVAGWGDWSLTSIDREKRECCFRVRNSWEGRYQKALGVVWGSGMLAGKMAGYCSKLFGTNCWANQTAFTAAGDPCDEFVVTPSTRSIEKEIDDLLVSDGATRADMAVALRRLEREIADHEHAVEALRTSEERYRALVETTGTGYVIVDRAGRVLDANDEYVRLSGHGALAEIVGRGVLEWTAPRDKERNAEAVEECVARGMIRNLEIHYVNKSGRLTPVELNATALGCGESMRILSLCRDITKRKQSEELLHNAQRLESLGVLAGGIAHDFNNLLTGILGYVDLARNGLPQGSAALENLDLALSAFARARALTQQLLTFSKGGLPSKRAISVPAIVREAMRFVLSGSNVTPRVDIRDDLWACEADGHQISQVFDNIIINARQAMPLGGVITVEGRNVPQVEAPPPPLPPGRYVSIGIRDQGIGIDHELLPRIFDPFFTTKQQGSGLGLATAYTIIKRHGGHIFVESEPGKGSTFTVFLPAAAGDAAAATKIRGAAPSRIKGSVLVVDDEEFVRHIGTAYCSEMGCSVTAAADGSRAIDLYREAMAAGVGFDLVILDLTIPGGKGGAQVLEELLRMDPTVKAIVSSGYSDDPVIAEPRKHGFVGKLVKPYLKSDFQAVVGAILADGKTGG